MESVALLRGGQVCVYSPEEPVGHFVATSHADYDWTVACNGPAAEMLARFTMLIAGKKEALVYIPKTGARPTWLRPHFESQDLVLCHHSLQLAPSAWKEMRQRLSKPRLKTLSIREPDVDAERPIRYEQNGAADVFDQNSHSGTLFLTASEPAFAYLAGDFQSLSTCLETGDNSHLFDLSRHERRIRHQSVDLTALFVADEDWL